MTNLVSFLRRGFWAIGVAGLAFLFLALPGYAQVPGVSTPPTAQATPDAAATDPAAELRRLEDLVGTLENPEARDQFIRDLKTLIAAHKQIEPEPEEELVDISAPETLGARLIFAISSGIRDVSENIMEGVSIVRELPAAGQWLSEQLSNRGSRNFWGILAAKLVLVLVGGYVVEWTVRRALMKPSRRLEAIQPATIIGRLLSILVRGLLDLLPLAGFGIAAYFLLPLAGSSDRARYVVLALVNAHILAGAVMVFVRMLVMPTAPHLRLRQISDETANYLLIWARRMVVIVVYGYFAAEAGELLGVSVAGKAFFLKLVGLITVAMLIVLVMQNRKNVADALRGATVAEPAGSAFGVFRRRLADVWHVLVAIYLIAFYMVWVLNIGFVFLLRATLLTVVILVAARLLIVASTRIVERAFHVGHDLTLRYPGLETRANRYLPALGRVLRSAIYVISVLLILQAWGVESLAWLTSRDGVRFIGTGLGILVVLTLALIVWEMISLGLDRYAARIDATSRSSARVRTLLPLIRTIILVVLTVMVGLVVLSQIGINITPLLAGAGVIGLAVGFGSQKLVQDVINGLFILAEDTVSVGDVIKVEGNSGVVEQITIRHIRLRDGTANVITIPFSEVKTIINMTRDYSRYQFNLSIAYKENIGQVIDVLKELDEGMRKDDRFAPLIIAPLEIQGVDKLTDNAVIVQATYTTLPMKQWSVGREFNRRVKDRFDELHIDFTFPTLTIFNVHTQPNQPDQAALPPPGAPTPQGT